MPITLDIQLADALVPAYDRSVFSCPSLAKAALALVSQTQAQTHLEVIDIPGARGSWGWF